MASNLTSLNERGDKLVETLKCHGKIIKKALVKIIFSAEKSETESI